MATAITDFTQFAQEIKDQNKYQVSFHVADKEYEITYSEMTSHEDVKSKKEFSDWFKRNFEKLMSKDASAIETAIEAQWNIWKMIKYHMTGLGTFEDFLNLPPQVVNAMTLAIQMDIMKRYPHLKKMLE